MYSMRTNSAISMIIQRGTKAARNESVPAKKVTFQKSTSSTGTVQRPISQPRLIEVLKTATVSWMSGRLTIRRGSAMEKSVTVAGARSTARSGDTTRKTNRGSVRNPSATGTAHSHHASDRPIENTNWSKTSRIPRQINPRNRTRYRLLVLSIH
jgi:hypothetical protein